MYNPFLMRIYKPLFWICLALMICLYGGFMAYFCYAEQGDPNNIIIEQKGNIENAFEPEYYLSQTINFYNLIITILFGTIGVILAASFIYFRFTSKIQTEDMAREALETKAFEITLNNMIATKANEFIEGYTGIPELEKRIEFLEEQVNVLGYELSDEDTSDE